MHRRRDIGIIIGVIIAAMAVAGIIVVLLITGKGSSESAAETTQATTEEADIIGTNVEEGKTYKLPVEIALSSSGDYRIYYTLDGNRPTNRSDRYEKPFKIEDVKKYGSDITLWVVTYNAGGMLKGEMKVSFHVENAQIDAPTITPESGDYTEAQTIRIKATSGCDIYYTTDGSTPDRNSTKYTEGFEMEEGNHVISAIAVKGEYESAVTVAVYNLEVKWKYSLAQATNLVKDYLKKRGYTIVESEPESRQETEAAETEAQEETDEDETLKGESEKETEKETEGPEQAWLIQENNCTIDGDSYYVLTARIYSDKGAYREELIYGVESTSGKIIPLIKAGTTFVRK